MRPSVQTVPAFKKIDRPIETLSPLDHPVDKWERLANEAFSWGDVKSGLRYLFLGSVAVLGERAVLTIRTSRSIGDYRRELARQHPSATELRAAFSTIARAYEMAWFGGHLPSVEDVARVRTDHHVVQSFGVNRA